MAKKKITFEIYEGFTKRKKKYVVTDIRADYADVIRFCKKLFKCSEKHIDFTSAFLYKGELYLDDPEKPGAKLVGVAYYV